MKNGTGSTGISLTGNVFDDGDKDKLKGEKERDWFLGGLGDQLKDKKLNEEVGL